MEDSAKRKDLSVIPKGIVQSRKSKIEHLLLQQCENFPLTTKFLLEHSHQQKMSTLPTKEQISVNSLTLPQIEKFLRNVRADVDVFYDAEPDQQTMVENLKRQVSESPDLYCAVEQNPDLKSVVMRIVELTHIDLDTVKYFIQRHLEHISLEGIQNILETINEDTSKQTVENLVELALGIEIGYLQYRANVTKAAAAAAAAEQDSSEEFDAIKL